MQAIQGPADRIFEEAKEEMQWQKDEEIYRAGAMLVAAQLLEVPISPRDIARAHDIDEHDVHYAKRRITRELDYQTPPTDPTSYAERFCRELGLENSILDTASNIIDSNEESNVGRAPTSIAAAAVYIASIAEDSAVTQENISEVANVSEVTIRSLYHEMAENAGITLT